MSTFVYSSATRRHALRVLAAAAAAGAFALVGTPARATNLTWNVGNGNFFTYTNWNPNSAFTGPGSGDNTFFTSAATYNVTFTLNAVTAALTQTSGNVTFVASPAANTFSDTLSGPITQNGGSLTLNHVNLSASTINAGGGAALAVLAGTSLTVASANYGNFSGTSTLTVDGGTFSATGSASFGLSGVGGALTLVNSAQASVGPSGLNVAVSTVDNSNGSVSVQSGADLTLSGNLNLATNAGHTGQAATLTVSGAGSTLTQSGVSAISVGASADSTATLTVTTAGTLTTGTGPLAVNKTGSLTLSGAGSTLNANGDINVNGGGMLVTANSTLNWAPGKTLTVTGDGYATFTQPYTLPANATVSVQGSGSALSTTNTLTVNGNASVLAGTSAGGALLVLSTTNVGLNTPGSLTVNNATLNLFGPLNVGNAAAGSVTVYAGFGDFDGSPLNVGSFPGAASAGAVTIYGSSYVSDVGAITVGGGPAAGSTGSLSITGSSVLQTGPGGLTVGGPAGTGAANVLLYGYAFLGVGSQGVTVNRTGTLNVASNSVLSSAGDVTVAGGTLTVESGSTLGLGAGRDVTVNAGGKLSADVPLVFAAGQVLTATDSNTTLLAFGGISTAAGVKFQNRAGIGIGPYLALDGGDSLIDGAGTSVGYTSASNTLYVGYSSSSTATATVSNSATASFVQAYVPGAAADARGTLTVSSGARVSAGVIGVGTSGTNNTGTVTVTGPGSFLTATGAGSTAIQIGASSGTTAAVTVADSATLYVPYGGLTLNPTGALTLDGGTLSLLSATLNGGAFNFLAGQVHFLADAKVGTGSLLGTSLALTPTRAVAVDGTLTVDPFRSLTLAGGSLTANTLSLASSATLDFAAGTLSLTSNAGVTFGAAGSPFGAVATIPAAATLNVPNNYATVSPGSLLVLDGTLKSAYGATNYGEIRLYTAPGSAPATLANGLLTNYKLVDGTGTVSSALFNASGAEIRATGAERLTFTSPDPNTNSGKINLVNGGTVDFTGPLTNAAAGVITGRGALFTSSLTNNGQLQFSAGPADVYGPVTTTSGGKVIVSGTAIATFYDPVTNNAGSEFRVSPGSTAVFFAAVTGQGQFTGTGAKNFEAGASAPAFLATDGSTFVDAPASLAVDYLRESSLTVSGLVTTNPNSPASRLNSLTIDPGATFDLANNKLVLDYTGPSPIDQIRQYLLNDQLTSSAAQNDPQHRLAIAYAEASQLGVSTWAGLPVDATSILTRLTYLGDANLDGKVDAGDFALLDRGFATHLTGWTAGDFDYDDAITPADYLLIDRVYAQQTGTLSPTLLAQRESQFGDAYVRTLIASVPEPTSLFATCGLTLLRLTRRIRRRD